MRPIRLTMSAFGPYAKVTTLDFSALEGQRLFVITGPTGSGKTTIFEAILYALYGKLSKRGMDAASLRCDFLQPDDDAVTFVDLRFEIGGKVYQIHRQPKQRVAKKRGTGRKEIAQEAVLECVGHDDFLPITKIAEVDKKIIDLVGLDESQFQKIVMLPQGAFQEFLSSPTKDKIELLRHIFDTGIYDLALSRVKERVSEMTGQYALLKANYQSQAAMLRFDQPLDAGEQPSAEALAAITALAAADAAQTAELANAAETARVNNEAALALLNKDQQHNEIVGQWRSVQDLLATLQGRQPEIADLRARRTALDQAVQLVIKEEQLEAVQRSCQEQIAQIRVAEQQLEHAARAQTEAAQRLTEATQERTAAEAAQQAVPALTTKLTHLKQYLADQRALGEARQALARAEKKQAETTAALAQLTQEIEQLETQSEEKRQLENALHAQRLAAAQMAQALLEARNLYKANQRYLDRLQAQASLRQKAVLAEAEWQRAEATYQAVLANNRQHTAAVLAHGLEEGTPCPVCGAVHHPAPAQVAGAVQDEAAAAAMRDAAQHEKAAAYAALRQSEASVREALAEVQELDATLLDEAAVQTRQADLVSQGKTDNARQQTLRAGIQAKEQALDALSALERTLAEKRAQLTAMQAARESTLADRSRWETVVNEKQAAVTEKSAQFSFTDADTPAALEQQIDMIVQRFLTADALYEQARAKADQAKVAHTAQASTLAQMRQQLSESHKHAAEAEQAFTNARDAVFANPADYMRAKADIAQKEQLQATIDAFQRDWDRAVSASETLSAQLGEDRSLRDLKAREAHCQQMQAALKDASERLAAHVSRVRANEALIEKLRAIYEDFQTLEAHYGVMGQLRDILDGKNQYNMRLETFAQAYYFERMLASANVRLARMTHGRYSFRRKDTVQDARKQAGLDLDVMDQYTGRARDVSTLSGGESFKASLSLALGLADVVSSESGGVELSTIFIDEGFGTLDEESLDDTVETLISLQDSGRLVGVISHVAELKERIPAHLVVSGGAEGSQAHFEVRE